MRKRRKAVTSGLLAVVAVSLVATLGPTAVADPATTPPPVPSYPSQAEIDAAKQDAAAQARAIAGMEQALQSIEQQRQQAEIEAASAGEDYNDAQVALQGAQDEEQAASAALVDAKAELDAANSDLARIAQRAYLQGGDLSALEPFLSANGLADALDRAQVAQRVGSAAGRAVARVQVAKQTADVAQQRATDAVTARQTAASAAAAAKQKADDAYAAAAQREQIATQQRAQAITVLAQLNNTTVQLETQRQSGIDAERQARANEAARQQREAAEKAAQEEAQRQAAERARQDRERQRQDADSGTGTGSAGTDSGSKPAPAPKPTPAPKPKPKPKPDSGSSATTSAAAAALAWARAQIGKRYVYGTDGPDTFDCSGLTSQAWLNGGGKWITRSSRSQYQAVTKVSYDNMRPGDLIFWASNPSNPSSIYHVAMYSGNGMMVEASNPDAGLRETKVRWANTMPYAGRP